MKVLVDTCVWSEALRKNDGHSVVIDQLSSLIEDDRVVLVGPVRQEILSGIKNEKVFNHIEKQLDPFPDLALDKSDYVFAARCSNRCRAKGIQGSAVDFLLMAVALNYECSIFTVDEDFKRFQVAIPELRLY
jgi:predicted nucleic acid-binding protein